MSNPHIIVERQGHILTIGINRPEKRNAIDLDMFLAMADAYGQLDRDPELRVGVVFAKGDHFSAGLDLAKWQDVIAQGQPPRLREGACDPFGADASRLCRKPIVFAVQGVTYTFAVEAMLAADIRIAARSTRLAQLEVCRGIFPFGGAPIRLVREIGWGHAMRYLLTGDEIAAEEAHRLGLVQELVEPGEELTRAMQIAERIAQQAPLAVQATLALARKAVLEGEKASFAETFHQLQKIARTQDVQEGLKAFLERRPGRFQGH